MSWKENVESHLKQLKLKLFSMNLKSWSILFLIGLLLLVLSFPTTSRKESNELEQNTSTRTSESKPDSDTGDWSEHGTILEQRLEQALSLMEGVGKVHVLIMTSNAETKLSGQYSTYDFSGNIPNSLFYEGDSEAAHIIGILVVAEGADNPLTVSNIKEACESLFQLEPHKIRIMKMK